MASLLTSRKVNRQLKNTSSRLLDARQELEVVGEQLLYVEEGPHEVAMQQHRAHLIAEVKRLETKLDRLLDRGPR